MPYTLQDSIAKRQQNPAFVKAQKELSLPAELAKQVMTLRQARGLTQKQLAKRIGTKQSGISRLENIDDSKPPSLRFLLRIADALNATWKIELVPNDAE